MKTYNLFLVALFAITLLSCSDDDDGGSDIINEEEVITTLNLSLTPTGGTAIVFSSRDLDADGPDQPVITVSDLAANTTYEGVIEVLNETESPAEDITEEVATEDDEHQFFFQTVGNVSITTEYSDMDDDDNPIGINFTLTTGDASTGNLVITLRHLLDKFADGVSDGEITNAGGDTDIEVDFPITIQ
ncbi:MAG: type 1 periplasmic binding fold superfamily protein [Saonia sp.]